MIFRQETSMLFLTLACFKIQIGSSQEFTGRSKYFLRLLHLIQRLSVRTWVSF